MAGREGGRALEDPGLRRRRHRDPRESSQHREGGGRVDRPGSQRKRAHSGNWDVLATSAGLRCGTAAPPELGPLLRQESTAGAILTGDAVHTASSQPARAWHPESPRKNRVPASAGARRGAPRRPEKKPQRPARTRTAGGGGTRRGAARREPGKDAPGGAGGAGARGGVAEPAESRAADVSAHPRSRLRSPRTSAEEAGPRGLPEAREGAAGEPSRLTAPRWLAAASRSGFRVAGRAGRLAALSSVLSEGPGAYPISARSGTRPSPAPVLAS